jgi:hypothetical protein
MGIKQPPRFLRQIRLFPTEPIVCFGRATKIAIGSGAVINQSIDLQMLANAKGRQIHTRLYRPLNRRCVHLTGTVGISIDRKWFRDADRITDTNLQ